MITDMTKGSPKKILWAFSIPMLISVIFQQLYNIVDSIVAGKCIGPDALAAVGASYPVTMIFMSIAVGANIGCSVIISQLFGAKDLLTMKTAVFTSLLSIVGISVLLTGIGLLGCAPIMKLLDTPDNIYSSSMVYLRIYICGLLFLFLYNICTGIFTALGDSRTPLYFLILSSISNIIMDIVFVVCFHMGISGVAWATFLCQGLSSVLALYTLIHRLKPIEYGKVFPFFSFYMLKRISLIAIPSILQQSFISVGNLFIQKVVNFYGSDVIAGYSAAVKLNTFALTSFTTLANGLSSFTAQNIGAGNIKRVKEGFRSGIQMTIYVVIPVFAAFFFFGSNIMQIFTDASNIKVIKEGSLFLRIVSPFYFIISIKLIADAVLRGSGTMLAFMIATLVDLIMRVILAYLFSYLFHSSIGIWISWPIGWVIAMVLSLAFYLSGIWSKDLAKK